MKKNKFLSVLGAAAIAFSALALPTAYADQLQSAEDILSDGAFEYVNVDGGYRISKCTASIITEIPAVRNGIAIVEIGENAFSGFAGITDLVIPDSVKVIGDNAFYGCTSITSLTLPKNLTSLGDGAFANCNALQTVTLPDKLTELPDNVFRRCDHLKSVTFSDNIAKIGEYAFYECTSIERIKLPSKLTEIGDMAFGEMLSLTDIDASACSAFTEKDGILTSSDKKDIYCAVSSLEGDLYIPDGTVTIKPGAFSASAGVENLYLPSTLTDIGYGAFSCMFTGDMGYCSTLKKVDFANGLETIGGSAFAFTSIESLSFPTTLREIGANAFENNYALSRVIIPDGVKSIGEKAFYRCEKLKSVAVPKSVSDIGDKAFGFTIGYTGETDEKGNKLTETVKVSDFKMSVVSGSAAKKYAKSSGVSYTVTDYDIRKIAFIVLCVALIVAAIVFAIVLMSRSRKLATSGARKAKKQDAQRKAEESYKKIVGDESDTKEDQ